MKFSGHALGGGFGILDDDDIQAESKRFKKSFLTSKTEKETSEWHAVEHKLINLLEAGQEVTLENLRNASEIRNECGIDNKLLRDPGEIKLKEGVRVGLEYLRLRKIFDSKNQPPPNSFSSQ